MSHQSFCWAFCFIWILFLAYVSIENSVLIGTLISTNNRIVAIALTDDWTYHIGYSGRIFRVSVGCSRTLDACRPQTHLLGTCRHSFRFVGSGAPVSITGLCLFRASVWCQRHSLKGKTRTISLPQSWEPIFINHSKSMEEMHLQPE